MVVTAAPGLGEAVVSGTVSPDTIRVRRRRYRLDIVETTVGDKPWKLVVNPDGGVREIATGIGETDALTLSEQQVLDICDIGPEVERLFDGSPQDIECAICDDDIYVLQSRDITAIDLETDKQLAHEIDTPIIVIACVTSGNAGEAASGAITPLTSAILINVDWATKHAHEAGSGATFPVFPPVTVMCSAHVFLNITALTLGSLLVFGSKNDIELAFMGQVVVQYYPDKIILECFGKEPLPMVGRVCRYLRSYCVTKWRMYNYESLGRMCDGVTFDDSLLVRALYERVCEAVEELDRAWMGYVFMVLESGKWSGVLMAILKGDMQFDKLTISIQADLALLLSECPGLISADVPKALEMLAETISKSDVKAEFMATPTDKCHDLLMNGKCPETRRQYVRFLTLHSHMIIHEYELAVKSWSMVPETLMKILKQLLREKKLTITKRGMLTVHEAVGRLQTKVSSTQRLLLHKWLVPWARSAVSSREEGKSVIVRVGDLVKQGSWALAGKLVKQGYLPDERLLFYMLHSEISELIETRSAGLVRRAKRRMKVNKIQEAAEYPVINAGTPVSLPVIKPELPASLTLTGLPVSLEEDQAHARVIQSVDYASCIQEGEILICPFTDIGWSPYFPLIVGLVTDIGRLVSHGVVVASEYMYGIPCLVCIRGTTKVFKTGDTVIVNGSEGTVKLVK